MPFGSGIWPLREYQDARLRSYFVPTAPTNVVGTAGNGQVSLTWTAASAISQIPVTDYVVQYSSNSGTTWTTYDAGAPYITAQPTNQTAANGAATFSVTAATDSGTLSYQWQRQANGAGAFANVAGATSASLTLTSLTNATNNGDVYRVVVSSSASATSVTSSTATLTVAPAGDANWSSVRLLAPFEDSTSDVGPSALSATGGNAPTYVTGKFGNAAQFNGTDFGRWANYATAAITGDLTLECWLQPPSNGLYYNNKSLLLLGSQPNGTYIEIGSNASPSRLKIGADNGLDNFVDADLQSLAAGAWTHLAVVRQGTTVRVYWNGAQIATLTVTSPPSLSSLRVSASSSNGGERFQIDDLRLTAFARYPNGTTFTPPTSAFPTS